MQTRSVCMLGVALAIVWCACGCHSTPQLRASSLFPDTLTGDAYRTYAAHVRAVNAGTGQPDTDIPPAYWAERIKALHPLKVYTHRVNIVVAQKLVGDVEHGTYICIPVSSYLPQSGDDGFTFTATGIDGVYDYKRSQL